MRDWLMWAMVALEAEGAGSGAADAGAAAVGDGAAAGADAGAQAPENVLFPNEGKAGAGKDAPAGTDKPKEGEGTAEGWKPYADDPAKSKEDNDKARAAHELTNPENPTNKVPDDGKYEFQMPEGMALDEKLAAAVSPVLKDLGLTRAQAQKLADVLATSRKTEAEAAAGEWAGIQSGWVDTARKDQEIGGAKWDASVKTAQSALAKFGTPELRAFLLESGGGNHPEVIRFMTRVGNAISDDKPANGDGGSGKPVEAAHVLFPSDKPKG